MTSAIAGISDGAGGGVSFSGFPQLAPTPRPLQAWLSACYWNLVKELEVEGV